MDIVPAAEGDANTEALGTTKTEPVLRRGAV